MHKSKHYVKQPSEKRREQLAAMVVLEIERLQTFPTLVINQL
ncbi:hypothetical protein HMPREF9104_03092 [Lentilactobacillus kisonensis F0435]|uniref:Uncharacterized protein n=1 Tax=Lentilactobacillus kisonensis F0435 TaxID=797516 RepID=H1LKE6_9LACO|nr:hypothetical protein HMPREF9104_03092 [Lentilactobacillus kisonensis F0435]